MIGLRALHSIYREHGIQGLATYARYTGTRALTLAQGKGVECIICGWSGREFRPSIFYSDRAVRARAICGGCGSLERHRACALFYRRFFATEYDGPVDILHFAPEQGLATLLRGFASRYRASDYEHPGREELALDLHDIDLPAESVQVAILNYVLCCTPNHRLSVENLYRIIRPGGAVLAAEVVNEGAALDEWGHIGQLTMYRTYGTLDLAEQFAPFQVEYLDMTAGIPPEEIRRLGLMQPQFMLVLRKPR